MQCPFLTGKYLWSCAASREVYIPSAFETEEYCTKSRYTMCPFYGKRQFEQPPAMQQRRVSGVHS